MALFNKLFGEANEQVVFDLPNNRDSTKQIIASPDSKRFAYIVNVNYGNHCHVEVNLKKGEIYDYVSCITFSPDSQHIAYVAKIGKKYLIVYDYIELELYDDIIKVGPVFSPDSKHIAYGARKGNEWYAVVDDKIVGGPHEGFSPGGIVFSPDSQQVLYVIKKGDSWTAVLNGVEQKPFPTIIKKSWCFSPDSKKIAYAAAVNGSWINGSWVGESGWVIGDEIQDLWKDDAITKNNGISDECYFSPDSKRIAYWVKQSGKYSYIIDGVQQKQYDGMYSGWNGSPDFSKFPNFGKAILKSECFVFSPDSRHFAYGASNENKGLLIYDGEEKKKHEKIANSPIVFSPDSNRIAYHVEENNKQFVILDWNPLKNYYGLVPMYMSFSPCSKHIAYLADSLSNGFIVDFFLIVDTKEFLLNGAPLIGQKPIWDDSNHLHILVMKNNQIIFEKIILE